LDAAAKISEEEVQMIRDQTDERNKRCSTITRS